MGLVLARRATSLDKGAIQVSDTVWESTSFCFIGVAQVLEKLRIERGAVKVLQQAPKVFVDMTHYQGKESVDNGVFLFENNSQIVAFLFIR